MGKTTAKVKNRESKTLDRCSGRKHFISIKQITKYSYICSLHFIDSIEEDPDPIIVTLQLRENAEKESRQVEHQSRVQKVVIIFHGVVNMCT